MNHAFQHEFHDEFQHEFMNFSSRIQHESYPNFQLLQNWPFKTALVPVVRLTFQFFLIGQNNATFQIVRLSINFFANPFKTTFSL